MKAPLPAAALFLGLSAAALGAAVSALEDSTRIVEATDAHARGYTGAGWNVAIIDTGVHTTHPMLAGRVVSEACYNTGATCPGGVTESTAVGSGEACPWSNCWHGTAVAAAAAGQSSSLTGVAPGAGIISIRIYEGNDNTISASRASLLKALQRVKTLALGGMKVAAVNISPVTAVAAFNGACDSEDAGIANALGELRALNIAPIVSAGNSPSGSAAGVSFPACATQAIAVAATTKSLAMSPFSHAGPLVRLLAPGDDIVTASGASGYATAFDASASLAAAHVTGAFAILKQQRPSASADEILETLESSGTPIADARNGRSPALIRINAAIDRVASPANLTSPSSGGTLSGSTVTFSWDSGSGVSGYHLYVGYTAGGFEHYDASQGTGRSKTITGIPTDGRPIHVRLWSRIDGVLHYRDEVFTAATLEPASAEITSHAPGETLTSGTTRFEWSTGVGATEYHLYVGSSPRGYDIYDRAQGVSQAATVPNIPLDGRPIFVTLFSRIEGAWWIREHSLNAPTAAAAITSPSAGATLPGSTATFAWSAGADATQYHLYLGSSQGAFDYYDAGQGLARSVTVTGLPTDSRTIYARLFTRAAGQWHVRDTTFRAAGLEPAPAQITYPAPGATLHDTAIGFVWDTGVQATEYYLYVGTTRRGYDLYEGAQGTAQTRIVSNLPHNNQPIYVTLFSRIHGAWQLHETQYLALDGWSKMFSPTPTTQLASSTVTFTWTPGTGVVSRHLYIGSSQGAYDILDRPLGAAFSTQVTSLPADGRMLWVRLWSRMDDGSMRYRDYWYRAPGGS